MNIDEMKVKIMREKMFRIGNGCYKSEAVCAALDALARKAMSVRVGIDAPDPCTSLLYEILYTELIE